MTLSTMRCGLGGDHLTPLVWVLIVFSVVAGWTQQLQIVRVIRTSAAEGHDVVDMVFTLAGLRNSSSASSTLPDLLVEDSRDVGRGMMPFRSKFSRPTVASALCDFFRMRDSPLSVAFTCLVRMFCSVAFATLFLLLLILKVSGALRFENRGALCLVPLTVISVPQFGMFYVALSLRVRYFFSIVRSISRASRQFFVQILFAVAISAQSRFFKVRSAINSGASCFPLSVLGVVASGRASLGFVFTFSSFLWSKALSRGFRLRMLGSISRRGEPPSLLLAFLLLFWGKLLLSHTVCPFRSVVRAASMFTHRLGSLLNYTATTLENSINIGVFGGAS